MSIANCSLAEGAKIVEGLSNTTPSSSTPDYVSLKNYGRLDIIISCKNATTVTGSAITLKQASAVAATGEKSLAFDTYWANTDTAATDTLVKTTAVSNTFTTDATNSKNLMYVISVKASDLDVANGFDCVRLGTGNAVATTLTAIYVLRDPRFAGATPPAAIVD